MDEVEKCDHCGHVFDAEDLDLIKRFGLSRCAKCGQKCCEADGCILPFGRGTICLQCLEEEGELA